MRDVTTANTCAPALEITTGFGPRHYHVPRHGRIQKMEVGDEGMLDSPRPAWSALCESERPNRRGPTWEMLGGVGVGKVGAARRHVRGRGWGRGTAVMRLRCESEESCGTEQESSTYEEESELLYATTLLCDTFRSRRRPLEASNPLQRRPPAPSARRAVGSCLAPVAAPATVQVTSSRAG